MVHTLVTQSHVVVVDSHPTGYRGLIALAEVHDWHLHFLINARAALQFARSLHADLWMIHVLLSDMSGFDLCDMLRAQDVDASMFMVCDQYNPDEERRACGVGTALYLCKDDGRSIDCEAPLKQLLPLPTSRVNQTVHESARRPP